MVNKNSKTILMISGSELVGGQLVFEETALAIPTALLASPYFNDSNVDLLAFHQTIKSLNLDKRDCELSIVQTDKEGLNAFKGSLKSTGMVRNFMSCLLNKVVAHDLERATGVERSSQTVPLAKTMLETMLSMGSITELDKVGFRGREAASFDGAGGLNMNSLIDTQENVIHMPEMGGNLNIDSLHVETDNDDEVVFGMG